MIDQGFKKIWGIIWIKSAHISQISILFYNFIIFLILVQIGHFLSTWFEGTPPLLDFLVFLVVDVLLLGILIVIVVVLIIIVLEIVLEVYYFIVKCVFQIQNGFRQQLHVLNCACPVMKNDLLFHWVFE